MSDSEKLEQENAQGLDRRNFLRLSALGLGAAALPSVLTTGCGGSSSHEAAATKQTAGLPTSSAWKFAVLGLYNSGIGFFPCRGNHDSSAAVATEFASIFPQTQSGVMNSATVYAAISGVVPSVDTSTQPAPSRTNANTFALGSNFSTIGSPSTNLAGLSYGFDYGNARLIFIDQFTTADGNGPDGNAYNANTTAQLQQSWITAALAGRTAGSHAFVFSHKGLITQQHIDVLFGACPADADFAAPANATNGTTAKTYAGSAGLNAFIQSMSDNDARLYFCGHDHIHNRSIVKSTASGATAQVTHQLCQSVSSKFYTPNENNAYGNSNVSPCTSNDAYFCGGKRQTQLSQEVYTVGYYIVTVDGANVTVDYYSAPAYPVYGSSTENLITATPTLAFTRRESSGYSLSGSQFVLANGADLTAVSDTSPLASGTVMQLLGGTAYNPSTDQSGRTYYCDVNTGWYAKTSATASDILMLWGLASELGSEQTGAYALSMTYTGNGSPVLATPDENGNWVNAADQTYSGAMTFVKGPWKSSYSVGTCGIDTSTKTVWAVLDYCGAFAAVTGL